MKIIEEYTKLVESVDNKNKVSELESKNSELLNQVSQLETQVSTSSNKEDKITELETKNSELLKKISELQKQISISPQTSSSVQTQPIVDEFLTSLDQSLTNKLNVSNIKTLNDQIITYRSVVTELQEQIKTKISEQGAESSQGLKNQLNSSAGITDKKDGKMNVEPKDAIMAIPVFSGEQKELDTFINTCDLYNSLVLDANKGNLLLIIKAKIRGEALSKVTPFEDCDTWEKLKKRIRDRIRKPVTLEFAQEDLNKISQGPNESMEDYGKKVKNKLRKLNEASRQLASTDAERAILQKANERLAISKFEQNIRDNTVRVLVSATKNDSLDDAIQMALQKELMEKNKNVSPIKCTRCGMTNHTVETCRRKQNFNENKNKNDGNRSFNRNFNKNDNKNDSKPSSSSNETQNKNSNQSQNQNFGRNQNKNGNQKNVKAMEEEMDSITLQEALDKEESDVAKNE